MGGRESETQQLLLLHAVLVGLTPLIPIPILDDAVKSYIERRAVQELGRKHGVELDKQTLGELLDDPDNNPLKALAEGALKFPLQLLFRKLFFVLEVKRASDAASFAYHRGYLVDRALDQKLLSPLGGTTPTTRPTKDIRKAIEWACMSGRISPLSTVMTTAFDGSRTAMEAAAKALLAKLKPGSNQTNEQTISGAVEDAAKNEGPLANVVAKLKAAIDEVPQEHFQNLEQKFDMHLQSTQIPSAQQIRIPS